ncbi:MAG TPA: peptidylprolyl isomerase [Longimicrobiales bacterium]
MRTLLLLGLAAAACGGNPCGSEPPPPDLPAGHVLLDPDAPEINRTPPDTFDVVMETSAGTVRVRIRRDWAPLGATRFYNLASHGFYDGARFFRVLPGFAAQFGMSGRPVVDSIWAGRPLPDEPARVRTDAGTLSYAMAGPDTRTTQLFFSYRGNEMLDAQGFAPIGRVVDGMEVLFRLYSGYGEVAPEGGGPSFGCIASHGNGYLADRFPQLDSIQQVEVVSPAP